MMLLTPKNIAIFLSIHLIYYILTAYLSSIDLNLDFSDRMIYHTYTYISDPLKGIMLLIAPSLIALYYILSMCRTSSVNISIPLTTTLVSGFSCLGCTFPILAGIGALSSLLNLLLPVSIILMLYLIDKKLVELSYRRVKC